MKDFLKTTQALMKRAETEVEQWESKLETLEDSENPSERELEVATRQLERWESILEGLQEVEELLTEEDPAND